jgi:hypothetical protein
MELQRDEYSVMTFNPETRALELSWSAGTASLTEDRFRQGLEQFAAHAVEHKTPNLLVDLREFAYRPAADMWEWRLEHISPLPRSRRPQVRQHRSRGLASGRDHQRPGGLPHLQLPHRGGGGSLVSGDLTVRGRVRTWEAANERRTRRPH